MKERLNLTTKSAWKTKIQFFKDIYQSIHPAYSHYKSVSKDWEQVENTKFPTPLLPRGRIRLIHALLAIYCHIGKLSG
jgi:hypothetical protein